MKNVNNFQVVKVQSQGVASICLIFFASFSMTLLMKMLLVNKMCVYHLLSICGTTLWKKVPTDTEKKQQKTNIFKTVTKNKLFAAMVALENELTYF